MKVEPQPECELRLAAHSGLPEALAVCLPEAVAVRVPRPAR